MDRTLTRNSNELDEVDFDDMMRHPDDGFGVPSDPCYMSEYEIIYPSSSLTEDSE
jgi:hypothetical protein